jgi:hypothetical protein
MQREWSALSHNPLAVDQILAMQGFPAHPFFSWKPSRSHFASASNGKTLSGSFEALFAGQAARRR